jgi:hypothetical protein
MVPVFIGLMWIYTSPSSSRLGKLSKVFVRLILFVAIFGGILVQEDYLSINAPSRQRSLYLGFCFLLEAIPMLFIMLHRYRENPERFRNRRPKVE